MSAPAGRVSRPAAEPGPRPLAVLRRMWSGLPTLAALNLVVCVAAVPALTLAFTGHPLLVPAAAALAESAVLAGILACCRELGGSDDAVDVRYALRRVRAGLGRGLRLGLPYAVVGTAAAATLDLSAHHPAGWLAGCLAVDGAALILLTVAGPYAHLLATDGPARGRTLWLTALARAAAAPAATASAVLLVGVTAAALILIGPALLLVLPAPALTGIAATVPVRGR